MSRTKPYDIQREEAAQAAVRRPRGRPPKIRKNQDHLSYIARRGRGGRMVDLNNIEKDELEREEEIDRFFENLLENERANMAGTSRQEDQPDQPDQPDEQDQQEPQEEFRDIEEEEVQEDYDDPQAMEEIIILNHTGPAVNRERAPAIPAPPPPPPPPPQPQQQHNRDPPHHVDHDDDAEVPEGNLLYNQPDDDDIIIERIHPPPAPRQAQREEVVPPPMPPPPVAAAAPPAPPPVMSNHELTLLLFRQLHADAIAMGRTPAITQTADGGLRMQSNIPGTPAIESLQGNAGPLFMPTLNFPQPPVFPPNHPYGQMPPHPHYYLQPQFQMILSNAAQLAAAGQNFPRPLVPSTNSQNNQAPDGPSSS